ncbi:MAG: nickel pincer cofactor biosynthesis protein LarC [Promethearchaeota archaeon]
MGVLYIDVSNSGISGDMFLASLLGLVPEPETILENLREITNHLSGVSQLNLELIKISRSGIQLNKLKVEIKETKEHRSAKTLQKSLNSYLNEKNLSISAKNYANQVLNTLIQAEAEVHGELNKNIHLHELSSVDTLIDIIGVTIALEKIKGYNENFNFYCSKIPLGGGKVNTSHGLLTVPAPATLKIIEKANLITYGGPIESELVTPTGIALLINLNPTCLEFLPEMRIKKSIYSTGEKEFKDFQNILHLYFGEEINFGDNNSIQPLQKYVERVSVLETDVDDVSGEILGNMFNEFKNDKVLDIQITPSLTKKNRPNYIIRILCYPKDTFELIEKIIYELGTLGVRYSTVNRVCVERTLEKRIIEINKKDYSVNFKVSYIESENTKEIVNIKPEYEDLRKISVDSGIPVREIQFIVQAKIIQFFFDSFDIKLR